MPTLSTSLRAIVESTIGAYEKSVGDVGGPIDVLESDKGGRIR
jgi:hypothetical protein